MLLEGTLGRILCPSLLHLREGGSEAMGAIWEVGFPVICGYKAKLLGGKILSRTVAPTLAVLPSGFHDLRVWLSILLLRG